MATFYLLNPVLLGTLWLRPGELLDDAVVDTTSIKNAGGVLWPSADTIVAAAAKLAQNMAAKGQNLDLMRDLMFGGVFASLMNATASSGASEIAIQDAGNYFSTDNVESALQALAAGTAGAGSGVLKATCTITQAADLAGLSAGVKTFDKNVGSALPSHARIVCVTAESVTDFDDGAAGTYTMTVGTSAGGNQIGTSLNVASGQTGFPKQFTAGAGGFLLCPQNSAQLTTRLTSNHDLNTATAGAVTVNAFYINLA